MTEKIQESYFINNRTVRLKDNPFNHIIELYKDIVNKTDDTSPSVAWSWFHYDADEYDLSEKELMYGIEKINHSLI